MLGSINPQSRFRWVLSSQKWRGWYDFARGWKVGREPLRCPYALRGLRRRGNLVINHRSGGGAQRGNRSGEIDVEAFAPLCNSVVRVPNGELVVGARKSCAL